MAFPTRSLFRFISFCGLWVAFILAGVVGVTGTGLEYALQGMDHTGEPPSMIHLFWFAVWPFACMGLLLLLSHLRPRRGKSVALVLVAVVGTVMWSMDVFPSISVEESLRERIPMTLIGCTIVACGLRMAKPSPRSTPIHGE